MIEIFKTNITDQGIAYRYYPFQFTTTFIRWDELTDAYMRPYHSLYEYGGWGIRIGSPKTGKAINTSQSCNVGLQLQFTDGRLLLIGTKNPAEIKIIIENIIAAGKLRRHV